MVVADYVELSPHKAIRNRAFMLPDGQIIAFGKEGNVGTLKGAVGTNNYNELWQRRQVYSDQG